ncbi:MAG TPA: pentapeptide repeat-containing protein [Acidimicrobiales bacterium]|nr:pentapeptide repeat-containing protein [Acidimicrobiales bacterium]
MCPAPWLRDESSYSDVLLESADLTDEVARDCTLDQVRFRNVSLVATGLNGRTTLTDVLFEGSDLAGAVWNDVSLLRVRFVDCRLSGFSINTSRLVDVDVSGCVGECPSFFESEGRRWLVKASQLPELDCRGLRLSNARFEQCELTKSDWGHAKLEQVSFVACQLEGLGGADGLSRATVDTATLLSVAPALARHLGMTVTP